jgi:hypothetical protein
VAASRIINPRNDISRPVANRSGWDFRDSDCIAKSASGLRGRGGPDLPRAYARQALAADGPTSLDRLAPLQIWRSTPLASVSSLRQEVAVLYLGDASALSFSCRRCAQLKYDSQRSGPRLRLMRKAQKLRRQLGGSGSLWKPFPEKPPTMQWKRYERVKEMARKAEEEWRRRSEFLF